MSAKRNIVPTHHPEEDKERNMAETAAPPPPPEAVTTPENQNLEGLIIFLNTDHMRLLLEDQKNGD